MRPLVTFGSQSSGIANDTHNCFEYPFYHRVNYVDVEQTGCEKECSVSIAFESQEFRNCGTANDTSLERLHKRYLDFPVIKYT